MSGGDSRDRARNPGEKQTTTRAGDLAAGGRRSPARPASMPGRGRRGSRLRRHRCRGRESKGAGCAGTDADPSMPGNLQAPAAPSTQAGSTDIVPAGKRRTGTSLSYAESRKPRAPGLRPATPRPPEPARAGELAGGGQSPGRGARAVSRAAARAAGAKPGGRKAPQPKPGAARACAFARAVPGGRSGRPPCPGAAGGGWRSARGRYRVRCGSRSAGSRCGLAGVGVFAGATGVCAGEGGVRAGGVSHAAGMSVALARAVPGGGTVCALARAVPGVGCRRGYPGPVPGFAAGWGVAAALSGCVGWVCNSGRCGLAGGRKRAGGPHGAAGGVAG